MRIPLRTVFNALNLTMLLIEHGVGINVWRQKTKKGLLPANHILRDEGTVPTSKPGGNNTGKQGNIWHSLHMIILIPTLHRLKKHARNDTLKKYALTTAQARDYIGHFGTLKAHIQQHFENHRTIEGFQRYSFPEDPSDLPENLKRLLDNEIQHNANHLVGRIVQAYYANKTGDYQKFGLPIESKAYFESSKKGTDLFERTLVYARDWVSNCPLHDEETSLATALQFYSWLANPAIVEMITPKFTGAASAAGKKLSGLVDFIYEETAIDLRDIVLTPTKAQKLRENTTLLERLKAIEAFFKRYHNDPEVGGMDISPIEDIRIAIWQPAEQQI